MPICCRPVEVAERVVPGHWEGDLIVGQKNKSCVGTLVERTSRYLVLLHLPSGEGWMSGLIETAGADRWRARQPEQK